MDLPDFRVMTCQYINRHKSWAGSLMRSRIMLPPCRRRLAICMRSTTRNLHSLRQLGDIL